MRTHKMPNTKQMICFSFELLMILEQLCVVNRHNSYVGVEGNTYTKYKYKYNSIMSEIKLFVWQSVEVLTFFSLFFFFGGKSSKSNIWCSSHLLFDGICLQRIIEPTFYYFKISFFFLLYVFHWKLTSIFILYHIFQQFSFIFLLSFAKFSDIFSRDFSLFFSFYCYYTSWQLFMSIILLATKLLFISLKNCQNWRFNGFLVRAVYYLPRTH